MVRLSHPRALRRLAPRALTRTIAALSLSALSLAALCTASLGAQQSPQPSAKTQAPPKENEGKTPIGWQTRFDATTVQAGDMHPSAGSASFVQMTPGFHVTTGPAGIYWHPDSSATGTFTVQSSIFIFPTGGRDREGYGVFVGGQDLRGAGQRYTYFLLRNDGRFLIKQRTGDKTTTLADWTPLAAIKLATDKDPMQNDLRVEVGAESVVFSVNGVTAATLPRARVMPDGVYGLRINHAVNLHVTRVARAM